MSQGDTTPPILIAGMGNLLRRDDGFGIVVLRKLAEENDLAGIADLLEVGIAGITLVQEFYRGYRACIIVDAIDQGQPPGQVYRLSPTIPDPREWDPETQREYVADTHYTIPIKALAMAKALGVLPEKVFIIGCQPETCEELDMNLSPVVAGAVGEATLLVRQTVMEMQAG